jgi:uncharacterized membrane protein
MQDLTMTRRLPAALAPVGLLAFCLPVLMIGGVIVWSLATGNGALADPADNVRRAGYPLALTLHIAGGMAMLALGIVQVTPALRHRFPRWHRWSGRLLVAGGLAIALSGLGMNASPAAKADSLAYNTAQTLAALALMGCLVAGVTAIRRKSVSRHRVWMVRAYALSLGAATQTVALLPVFVIFGPPSGLVSDAVLIAAWPVNLLIANLVSRKAVP